ncbi:MAG: hypothetical protein ACOYT4_04000 [Nanoarchaeota archaeon]
MNILILSINDTLTSPVVRILFQEISNERKIIGMNVESAGIKSQKFSHTDENVASIIGNLGYSFKKEYSPKSLLDNSYLITWANFIFTLTDKTKELFEINYGIRRNLYKLTEYAGFPKKNLKNPIRKIKRKPNLAQKVIFGCVDYYDENAKRKIYDKFGKNAKFYVEKSIDRMAGEGLINSYR